MNFCTKCGNQLKPNAKFCGKCGETVKSEVTKIPQPLITDETCISCGTVIAPGIWFCTVCGAPVNSPAAKIHQPAVSQPPVSARPISGPLGAIPSVKRSRKKIWIISVLLVVLLAGISAAAWFYLGEANIESNEEEIIRPEYAAHAVVNGTTTEEKKEINVSAGNDASIVLSDSCSVLIPGLKGDARVVLKKETNIIELGLPGIETSGYMVSLIVQLSDSNTTPKPIITIPQSQVGDINPATVNIVRISDVFGPDGQVVNKKVLFLPVTRDKAGNYVALDYMFPYTASSPGSGTTATAGVFSGLGQMLFKQARAQDGKYHEDFGRIANVVYSIITFQGELNWAKNPRLVQMIPARNSSHFRRPASEPERTKRTNPVVNVIVLVHGHNEVEQTGFVESSTKDVWEFDYKRDLWDYIYKYYLDKKDKSIAADKNKEDDCTLFYEFIYPSYRPIYTPVPDGKSNVLPHRTLGQDLGEALNKELIEKNPQVAQMIKNNIPFNIYIVSHSMGGLVSRAGLRFLDQRLEKNFRQLITWGSPHQGSPLTTLRYIMSAGFDVSVDGYAYRPDMYGNGMGWLANWAVIDAPGSRDLRWTNGSAGVEKFFKYDRFFKENSVEKFEGKEWDLRTGSMFYNDNLKIFNDRETFSGRFTFFTGNTEKIAEAHKGNYPFSRAYYLVKAKFVHGDIAIGAYFLRLLSEGDKMAANDGASPVYSQGGFGLFPQLKTVDMGDINHEEFYGSRGYETAEKTFEVIKNTVKCDCPYIADYKIDKDKISAMIVWPGDPNPGKRIDKIEAIITDTQTKEVVETSTDFNYKDPKGSFSGTISVEKEYSNKELQLLLRVITREKSNVDYKTDFSASPDAGNVCGIYEGTYSMKINQANIEAYYNRKYQETGDVALDEMMLSINKDDSKRFLDKVADIVAGNQGGPTIRFEIAPTKGMESYYETTGLAYTVHRGNSSAWIPGTLTPLKDKSNKETTLKCSSSGFTVVAVDEEQSFTIHGKFQGNKLVGDWTASYNGKVLHSATFIATKISEW
jgi:ribosomal protein L37AE/L43A